MVLVVVVGGNCMVCSDGMWWCGGMCGGMCGWMCGSVWRCVVMCGGVVMRMVSTMAIHQ